MNCKPAACKRLMIRKPPTARKQGIDKGYVMNATETCNPSNPFQLVVDVQAESNITDDSVLLTTALPELVERTDVNELYTDGGASRPCCGCRPG